MHQCQWKTTDLFCKNRTGLEIALFNRNSPQAWKRKCKGIAVVAGGGVRVPTAQLSTGPNMHQRIDNKARVSAESDSQNKITRRPGAENSFDQCPYDPRSLEAVGPRSGNGTQKVHSLFRLQRQYGNRFVQRAIDQPRFSHNVRGYQIHRSPDEEGLTRVEIVLIEAKPPTFRVFLMFKKETVTLTANLIGKEFLETGEYRLSATGISNDEIEREKEKGNVLFTLPDRANQYIYVHVASENLDKLPALIRAQDYLKKHEPVTLVISEAAKGSGAHEFPAETIEVPAPKFVDAEAWLTKELLPAVRGIMSEKYSSLVPERLIGYQSLPIQKQEGPDVSMIQIDKEVEGKKQIVGHVRVYRSKWVGKESDARTKYAEEVASAVAEKMRAFDATRRLKDLEQSLTAETKGLVVPPWVVKLEKEVETRLNLIRRMTPSGEKPPADLPDKIHIDPLGSAYYFRLIVEQQAVEAPDKMVWNSAVMTPALDEAQLDDVDRLVAMVRAQTAVLRSQRVSAEKSDEAPVTKVLMQQIPSEITSTDLSSSGATVTGATNTFKMSVRIDLVFGNAGSSLQLLDLATIGQQMRLPWIDYEWKVQRLTEENASQLVTAPPKPETGEKPSAVYSSLSDKDIDQKSKIELANQKVQYRTILDDPAYPIVDTNRGTLKFEFPKEPGAYLMMCRVTPAPTSRDSFRHIYPASKAVFPVRVVEAERLAKETVSETAEKLEEKQKLLENKDLTDKDRADLQRDIDRLKGEEGMSHLELTKLGLSQLEEKMTRLMSLKTWMIEDRKKHLTTTGTETENPFVIRLLLQDKLHSTHFFDAWHELYTIFGERAFDVRDLEKPHTTPEGQQNALNGYLKALEDQKAAYNKLIGTITAEQKGFLDERVQRPVATLIGKEKGEAIPLMLMVGETPDSKVGAYKYRIVDLTLSSAPVYKRIDHIFVGEAAADRASAIRSAFITYGEQNQFPEGVIVYRFPPDTATEKVPNVKTIGELAEEIALYLALIGLVVSVAVSGGATTPALAIVAGVVAVANAALAAALAARHLKLRHERGTLEMDIDVAFDIINIIASVVGLGTMAKGAQLAKVARTAGTAAKAAQALGQLQRLGKLMLVFDVVTLGSTAVLVSIKVSDDVAYIKSLKLPKAQEDALLQQVTFEAVTQGAMLAFQTVAMARMHLEAYRSKLENSRYKSLSERGWVDEAGNPTQKAPPFVRAAAEGTEPILPEKPPMNLENELPLLKQASEEGKVAREGPNSEYDASVKIKLQDGEEHTYRRRREDGAWCRFTKEFCFITQKDIDRIVDSIGPIDEPATGKRGGPAPRPTKGPAPKGARGTWATLTQDLQAKIDEAAKNLRKALGKQWLLPHIYGTKLHKQAADLFKAMKLPKGWSAIVEKPLRMFKDVKPATLKMTVEQFLDARFPELKDAMPEKLLKQRIGDLEPDLVLIAPDGTHIIFDLAPSSQPEHLAKTMLYAHVLGETGKITQIGESYYKWQSHIEINADEQGRFQGTSGLSENAVVTLADKQILSLLKQHAGSGKATVDLPAGMSGAIELITSNEKVVGRFFNGRKWVETTNFSIHYTEGGLFIRPEKP
jgi:hypothetical protein